MSSVATDNRHSNTVMLVAPSMGVGGAERQYFVLMTALAESGWRPVLVTLNGTGRFFDEALSAGIDARFLDVPTRRPILGALRLRRAMLDVGAEVVLARGFTASALARLASRALRPRPAVVIAEHSTGPAPHQRWYHRLVERLLIPLADQFVAVAENQLDYLVESKRLPPDRIKVVHNGIDYAPYLDADRASARSHLGIGASDFVVGIVAALRPEKDHLSFIRAAALLDEATGSGRCRFVVAGDGPMRSLAEREIERHGLNERFIMLGAVDDVAAVYASLDVFTLCSTTVETLPMAGLEAMGSGIAVVATDVGGLPELVDSGRTGILVSPGDPKKLCDSWKLLYDDRTLCRAMGLAGREKAVSEFSAVRMGEGYAMVFERAMTDRTSREL